ncbi:circularly permuted type 2 ATP-grasp protein [Aliihoeflea sp. PC F10.4]
MEETGPTRRRAALMGSYHPPAGAYDELLDATGAVRPLWRPMVGELSRLSAEKVEARIARGDEYLRDAGVYLRQFGSDDADRVWPLSHLPVLIDEDDWSSLVEGLAERADLLERVVADLYGENRLVAEGHLPASLIAQSPEWLRPMVGVEPASGHRLHLIAFDVARGPDGRWWVLGDRTQAPSGAGFALENRVATARVFSELYARSNVHRLAGFFRDFRENLQALAPGQARSAILTPGPLSETYFEHAYIARYLGMTLLEGEDLVVEQGRLMVRTVSGLEPVGALWRRLDASYADPLELDGRSQLGTPGLVSALRAGTLSMVNALGVGILETRALLAFMPRLGEILTGRQPCLPNVATWWCGDQAARAHIDGRTDLHWSAALSTRLPYEGDLPLGTHGFADPSMTPDALRLAHPELFVAQEIVSLSATPVLEEGCLAAGQCSLRVFLARTPQGWQALPGGYARIASGEGGAASLGQGGRVADVWVVAKAPVERVSLLGTEQIAGQGPRQGALPSRAADNLFWLGRYVERAEDTMRLVRAYRVRADETGDEETPLLTFFTDYLTELGVDTDQRLPEGLAMTIGSAVFSASKVRDRLSIDGWAALKDLSATATSMQRNADLSDAGGAIMGILLRKITGFSGLAHENMYRFAGWRFMRIGRSLERAAATSAMLCGMFDEEAPGGALDIALEVGDSVMTHRRRYSLEASAASVAALLVLDPMNPRSILFQVSEIDEQVNLLPDGGLTGRAAGLARATIRLRTLLATALPDEVDPAFLDRIRLELEAISDHMSRIYLA